MSIGENVVLNKLTSLLSYQVTVASKLDVCILQCMSPLSGPSLAKVNACGHPFLLVFVVLVAPIPFNIKSQNNLGAQGKKIVTCYNMAFIFLPF
jgi:hypothetical protein